MRQKLSINNHHLTSISVIINVRSFEVSIPRWYGTGFQTKLERNNCIKSKVNLAAINQVYVMVQLHCDDILVAMTAHLLTHLAVPSEIHHPLWKI